MVFRGTPIGRATLAALVLWLAGAARARAQSGAADVERRGAIHGGARPPRGFYEMVASHPDAFEFRHGWLERARAVRANRGALRARGQWGLLNASLAGAPAASTTAVAGTLAYPTFMVFFSNTTPSDSGILDSTAVANRFWGTTPAPPYSVTTYYQEISVGRLTVTGNVIRTGIKVSQPDTFYAGGRQSDGTYCQGLCPASKVPNLIAELILHADSTVDFSQYADPAKGIVPGIVILDPQVGGECYQVNAAGTKSIWAHRWAYSGWTGVPITTNDPWPGHPGQFIKIDDYIIQGGQGGNAGCASGQLAPIGTVTHETGHLFGLPDLYDTGNPPATEGIGHWDLMAAGNEWVPSRPAHMSAWSLATLGWITETPVSTARTVTTGPIESTDTAFVVPIASTSEYFLLENRQPLGSDAPLHGPGLLIYHADSALIQQRLFSNVVNAIAPHGLELEQADGLHNLDCPYPSACVNRGDAGDPYPGTTLNTVFGFGTNPAANGNSGAFSGVVIDSIQQLVPSGAMSFRVRFGSATVVSASDTTATIVVDATRVGVYRNLLADGSTHTIAADSSQVSLSGRTQFLFVSWSDGGARTHTITGSLAGATYTATLSRRYLAQYTTVGIGTVSATRTIDPVAGTLLAEGDSVTLTAVPGAGQAFAGWTGDTTASAAALVLHLVKPYAVTATFLAAADVVTQILTGTSALTAAQLTALDQLGNRNGRFDLGDFVAWLDRNPGAVSAATVARILRRAQP